MKIAITFLISLSFSSIWAKTIILLPQHHLLAAQKDLFDEKAKEIPQYQNQSAIYLVLKEWISTGKLTHLLAEGCEGEIDNNFKSEFNGYNYKKLSSLAADASYDSIMTMIPLKIEAKFKKKVLTLCADNLSLIKKHQLIFSDLRAYAGFYHRLKSSPKDSKSYQRFSSLLNETEKKNIERPLPYLKNKIMSLISQEEQLLYKRNDSFIKEIAKLDASPIAVVIGARHIEDLKIKLIKNGNQVQIPSIILNTIDQSDLVQELKKVFNRSL